MYAFSFTIRKCCFLFVIFFQCCILLLSFKRVCILEQQNKILETKWSLLQKQTSHQTSIDNRFKSYIANLHRELDGLGNEKGRLEYGLQDMRSRVEDFKSKWDHWKRLHSVLNPACLYSKVFKDIPHTHSNKPCTFLLRYEDEIIKRNASENEFVLLKNVSSQHIM